MIRQCSPIENLDELPHHAAVVQRFLIITLNGLWLALLLIGLPAATHARFGDWQISSNSTGRVVLLWGLGLAIWLNVAVAVLFLKVRKAKIVCWEWAVVFAALLLAYFAYLRGYLHFDWLTRVLQWLQQHL